MKKGILSSIMVIATSLFAMADVETVKIVYDGDPIDVTWENPLQISADKFEEGVNAGCYILIALDNATDVLEIKADGVWLPGSRYTWIEGCTEYKAYITDDMLAKIKEFGLEIVGKSFTVTSVSICNDGFQMPDGAIWGGYFWVDNWNTLELFRTAFNNYNGERYLDIYHEAGYDSYVINVMTAWDDENAKWSKGDKTVKETTKATIDLTGLNIQEIFSTVDRLFVQLNPEGGNPFNVTAIALRADQDDPTGVGLEVVDQKNVTTVYNMQGIAVRSNVDSSEALEGLPAGLYIVGGNKVLKK